MSRRKNLFSDIDDFSLIPERSQGEEDLQNFLLDNQYKDGMTAPADEKILFYNGIPIGSRGNIVAINGKAKSRKSVIASAIMSSAFIEDPEGFLGFTCQIDHDAKVLNFDTEQGLGHWIEGSRRVVRDAGFDKRPLGFYSHHTREKDVEERLQLFEYALKFYNPDIAVLDGITDVVYDLNSQEEATTVGGKLMRWSVKYNCLIVTVIHLTKGTGYMTGALGTYLEKKCQTAIKCEKDEKDEDISHVTCQYSRDRGFPPFAIMYDEDEKHYYRLNEEQIVSRGPKANNYPDTKSAEFKLQFISALWRLHSGYKTERDLRHMGIKTAGQQLGMELKGKEITAWADYFKASGEIAWHADVGFIQGEKLRDAQAKAPPLPFDESVPDLALGDHEPNPVDDLPF